MKNYEIITTINPDLSEGELGGIIQKLTELVVAEGGEITRVPDQMKKSLGYKIKGKKEAFIVYFNASLPPEKIAILIEKFKKESLVLRPIIIEIKKHKAVKEARTLKGKKGLGKAGSDDSSFNQETSELELKPEVQKVEMKEIDQKIEEILSE